MAAPSSQPVKTVTTALLTPEGSVPLGRIPKTAEVIRRHGQEVPYGLGYQLPLG